MMPSRNRSQSGGTQLFEVLPGSGLFVLYHGKSEPSEADWASFTNKVSAYSGQMRSLVYSASWRPSREQNKRINEAMQGRKPFIAIVSSSTAVAFVVSVFTLMNRRMRFFKTDKLPQVFKCLRMSAEEMRIVNEMVEYLGVIHRAAGNG